MKSSILFLILFSPFLGERKPGSPLDHLPKNIEVLTYFGERADFSPDNQRIAFMTKSFGDAMVIDLKTRKISCLTCNVPAAAFLRVMHLTTGDYILIGPDHFEDIHVSRLRDNELWFLSKERGSKPVKLGQKMNEGAAVSKKSMKIAFSQVHAQAPDLAEGASRIVVADIDLSGGTPKLINQKTVYESKDRNCVLEAQDFYDNDSKLSFVCYEPNDLASVWAIDFKTNQVTNFTKFDPLANAFIGDENYNAKLSYDRATSAQQIIERALANTGKKGIKFETYGFGEDAGMSPFENNLPEERFYNRTVIIDIISSK